MKGDTRLLVPHTPQYIVDQVPMCAQKVPQVVEQERSPTRDPPQSVSSSRSPRTGDGGGPRNAPVDAEDVPHRTDVYVTDASGEEREAREQQKRLVVQVHGQDFALGHGSQPELRVSLLVTLMFSPRN